MKNLRTAYLVHRTDAIRRGIEFLLTFEEWLGIWKQSGHLNSRGRGSDQYQMARFGDKGPYSIENVKIITGFQNRSERAFSPSKQQRQQHSQYMMGANNPMFGKTHKDEARKKISKAHAGKKLSYKHRMAISAGGKGKRRSALTKSRISLAMQNRPINVLQKISKFAKQRPRKNGKFIKINSI